LDKVKRIKELVSQLNTYRNAYYNNSESQISDYEYDNLFDELKQLENETGVIMSNSPTQTVGYEVKSKLEKVKHSHPMLSLDKTKSVEDLIEFAGDRDCLLSLKMDGLTVLLTYDNGELVQAESRGNGEIGELITHNAKVFTNIPLNIEYKGRLEVEGEAIITYPDFEKINSKLSEEYKYKNPRNLVSGSVRQLDSNIAAQRYIKFIAWKVPEIEEEIKSDDSFLFRLQFVKNLGFDIVPLFTYTNKSSDKENINKIIESLKNKASEQGFPIDGLVMVYDSISYGVSLGMTGHHPRHSIAFKFFEDEMTTILRNIEWTMGKTGVLTPTAIFDSVELEGTSVERASLHNISICKELQLGIGDEITVYKANAIIPQVRENLTKSNSFSIPEKCPICGGKTSIIKEKSSEIFVCDNSECKGKLLGKLSHFVSKNAVNIDGLSEQTLEKLIELGWLNSFQDIYRLSEHKDEMSKLDGFGKKSVEKLLDAIEKSRSITLDRFIYALCIPLVGRSASKTIAKYFNYDFKEWYQIGVSQPFRYTLLDDFGETMQNGIHNFVVNMDMISDLADEFTFEKVEEKSSGVDLSGKVFVITGSLVHYKNRDELVGVIESLGAKVSGSVSAKTSYLINNDVTSTSGKNSKAKQLGIPIISEEDFLKMIG
jgi:DNA ligase (NAD+)